MCVYTIKMRNVSKLVLSCLTGVVHTLPPSSPCQNNGDLCFNNLPPRLVCHRLLLGRQLSGAQQSLFPFLFCKIPSMILRFLNLSVLTRLHIASLGPNPIIFMLVNNRRLKGNRKTLLRRADKGRFASQPLGSQEILASDQSG